MSLDQDRKIWFGDLSYDPLGRELRGRVRAVRLDRRACDVLDALIAGGDRALLREEILQRVWPDTSIAPGSVTVQVHALRAAFRQVGCRVETIRTLRAPPRYQLCLDVTPPPQTAARQPALPALLPTPPSALARPGHRLALAAPVLIGALAWLAVTLWPQLPSAVPPANSIAVRPFADLTAAQRGRDFAADFTRDLIGDLTATPSLHLAAGAPALAGKPPQARYILEGSLTDDAGQLHITYALIDSATGRQVDGTSFAAPDAEMAETGRRIARRVAGKVQP